jgi:hypothetical protein
MQAWLSSGVTPLQASMVIAHRPNAVAFPPIPRLAAHFTSAKRFRLSGFDALPYGVRPVIYVDTKPAEFLFDLQDFERASGCFLGFRNERLQVFAQPPHDVEPAGAMGKAVRHSVLALIACEVEPRRPMLFQFLLHVCSSQLARVRQVGPGVRASYRAENLTK